MGSPEYRLANSAKALQILTDSWRSASATRTRFAGKTPKTNGVPLVPIHLEPHPHGTAHCDVAHVKRLPYDRWSNGVLVLSWVNLCEAAAALSVIWVTSIIAINSFTCVVVDCYIAVTTLLRLVKPS